MVISFTSGQDKTAFKGMYHCEHKQGQLIYAILKAETLGNALAIANFLVKQIQEMATSAGNAN